MATDMTVANTILAQLGGNRFIMMTGSKNLVGDKDSLAFKVGRNGKGVTHVRIKLEANDTYTVRFMAVRGANIKDVMSTEGTQAGDLRSLFEYATELRISL